MKTNLKFLSKIALALLATVLPCDAAIRGAKTKEQDEAPTDVSSTTRRLQKAKVVNRAGGRQFGGAGGGKWWH
jgi:hypothetical protein